jgi:hypothetical protein
MAVSPASGVHAYQRVQHAQPVKRDDHPPVKEKEETPPPKPHHAHAKKKHKVDVKA